MGPRKLAMMTQSIIKNKNLPACINCIFFNEHSHNYQYDDLPDKTIHLSTCKKFGTASIISGRIDYELAEKCRTYTKLCGLSAKHFIRMSETEQNKPL